ncbi:flagellar export chaperone FliS [Candidatus Formimonas warabiya]|uniref:Flagellar secretion chaperone FliS n=1 Tax=Formimonas warabiya TaxID=1761012 RepID=A0A3G1KTD0_FORW1|nr:flagellar export chaperone FliS [Candidatus Formimonas warabiya]ATW25687.1 flagellar export chaperone FliS [Candidatus Formimonas warabiya]
MANINNPYQVYRQTQIKTASQGDLVLMLYDGAIRFTKQAAAALEEKNWENSCNYFVRAQDIVEELDQTLDLSVGEVAENLHRVYRSMKYFLVRANMQKDPVLAGRVCKMLEKLRAAWAVVFSKSPGHEEREGSIGA